jgi:thiamine biosynthesis lipoprotein
VALRLLGGARHVARDAYLMGTRVRLQTYDVDRAAGLDRLNRALEVLEAADRELSTWVPHSTISTLNRVPIGWTWRASAALCDVLRPVARWHDESGGTFDPAIGRLIEAWDLHGTGRVPTGQELARALESSGLARLEVDWTSCSVTRLADATLDVGAFGKGEAIDRAARVLGDEPWLVDLGGQIAVHGAPPGIDTWPAAVASPVDRRRPLLDVFLRSGSLSTSARSERDLIVRGRRVGHILDPRTGRPAEFAGSVSVWHPRALTADILSTALFVMGPDAGLAWAEERDIAACFLVPGGAGGIRPLMTRAFRPLVTAGAEAP